MKREYPERPLVGVGAVILEENRILLIKRASEPNKGLWSVPGGLVRLGERLEDALKREVKEETGLEVEVGDLAFVAEEIIELEGIKYHYIIIDFFASIKGGELRAGSDALDVRWFDLDDPNSLENVVDFVGKITEEIKAGRKGVFLR
ncbi:MAG: NUDIX hydrolase [Archaeoglobus sp.]|nr:NUDIX hydrolase [Archaeoglobus sp.]